MTDSESILSLPAGRALDSRVAVEVMGWSNGRGFYPSTRIRDAWAVVRRLVEMGRHPTIHVGVGEEDGELACWVALANPLEELAGDSPDEAPLLIARAALLAVASSTQGKE